MERLKCKECEQIFKYENDETFYDENGFGYSTKLVKCKHCEHLNILKYNMDLWVTKGLLDKRYYE